MEKTGRGRDNGYNYVGGPGGYGVDAKRLILDEIAGANRLTPFQWPGAELRCK